MANGILIPGDVSVMHKSWYRLLRREVHRRRKLRRKKERGEEDDSGLVLPMELVEKILARVPFPDVFKGRVLSRSWRRKFSLASQRLRPPCPLLNELSSAATRWPSFCPVYMTPGGDLMGYNDRSHNWEKIVISAYIPINRTYSNLVGGRAIEFGGSLMCIYEEQTPFYCMGLSMCELFVANIQTGRWKTIVCPKQLETSENPQVVVFNGPGLEDYKLLAYDVKRPYELEVFGGITFEVYLFDSASNSWTSKESSYSEAGMFVSSFCTGSHQVHVDGNLYLMGAGAWADAESRSLRSFVHVIKYNMMENVWSKSSTSVLSEEHEAHDVGGVFLCGSKLMMVTLDKDRDTNSLQQGVLGREIGEGDGIRAIAWRSGLGYTLVGACVFEVSPETLEIESVSASPRGIFRGICRSLMSDGNNIYFVCSNCPGRVKAIIVRYNVSTQSWDHIPSPPTYICRNTVWARSAYVPGQNPFALV